MRKILAIFLFFVLCNHARSAVTIIVDSTGGPCFALSGGGNIPAYSIVRVGFFDLSAPGLTNILQTSNDYSQINSLFTPLAEGLPGSGTVQQADPTTGLAITGNQIIINNAFNGTTSIFGHIYGQIANVNASYIPAGSNLFLWVFNNSNPSNATEWGIFSANSGWSFPSDLGTESLQTSEISLSSVYRGSENSDNGLEYRLAPIPEPSSAVMLMLVGGVWAGKRRRLKVGC
jgi:hypothetical protein